MVRRVEHGRGGLAPDDVYEGSGPVAARRGGRGPFDAVGRRPARRVCSPTNISPWTARSWRPGRAWKRFRPRNGPAGPRRYDPGNPTVNFRGERRRNDTHQSTTDPEARLYRKGPGRETTLSAPGPCPARQPAWPCGERPCDRGDRDGRTRGGVVDAGGERAAGEHGRIRRVDGSVTRVVRTGK